MDILECKLKNCYGIDEFNHEFDFTNTNVITVYAKNGLMKTSFAKTFKKIQDGKADEIRDEIFDIKAEAAMDWQLFYLSVPNLSGLFPGSLHIFY